MEPRTSTPTFERPRGGGRGAVETAAFRLEPQTIRERIQRARERKTEQLEEVVNRLGHDELKEVVMEMAEIVPGMLDRAFDKLNRRQGSEMPSTPTPPTSTDCGWCRCGHCSPRSPPSEQVCCGQPPHLCRSQSPDFVMFCINPQQVLLERMNRNYREGRTLVGEVAEHDGDERRCWRYGSYRLYTHMFWGYLGRGNRRVHPSCCVWAIRDMWPDQYGHYKYFQEGDLNV